MGSMLLVGFFWALVENLGCMIPRGIFARPDCLVQVSRSYAFYAGCLGTAQRHGSGEDKTFKNADYACFFDDWYAGLLHRWGVSIMPIRDVWAVSWTSSIMLLGMAIWILKERVSLRLWVVKSVLLDRRLDHVGVRICRPCPGNCWLRLEWGSAMRFIKS